MDAKDILVPLASVLVAVLVFAGVLVNALVRRKKPVETTDLWTRNDKVQGDLDALRAEFEDYRTAKDAEFTAYRRETDAKMQDRDRERSILRHFVSTISEGFAVAAQRIALLEAILTEGGSTVPPPNAYARAAMAAAEELRTTINLEAL